MKIGFASEKLESIANGADNGSYSRLDRLISKQNAPCTSRDIVQALVVLQSVKTCADIPPSYHPHPLKGKRCGDFAIDIPRQHGRGRFRLIFRPTKLDEYKNGDHHTIQEVTIVALIEDYHD